MFRSKLADALPGSVPRALPARLYRTAAFKSPGTFGFPRLL
jgi:hypothetical protein